MIRKLKIRNFLSFKQTELDLGLTTALVGPNMSGKSNLIACLKFLAESFRPSGDSSGRSGLERAVFDSLGMRELAWKGSDDPSFDLGIVVDAPVGGKKYEYELSVVGSLYHQQISVARERLISESEGVRETIFEVNAGQGRFKFGGTMQQLNLGSGNRTTLEALAMPDFEGTIFRTIVETWRFYRLIPFLMREDNRPTPEKFLQEHGANLSSWLLTLQTYPEEFAQLKQTACDVLPSLSDILIQPTQAAAISVSSREAHLKRPVSVRRMSDGELAFLALLSLVFAPSELGAPLYCVEEPESHLHPLMMERLVELVTQRQAKLGAAATQIIITTHSPQLVDKISINDLRIVEKVEGASRFLRPSDDQHLRELVNRRELGLGDICFSGSLAGT